MSNNSTETAPSRPPWPADRWLRRIEGIHNILDETIALAEAQKFERLQALLGRNPAPAESEHGDDYFLLPDDYQEGRLAHLFRNDSDMNRIDTCLGMLSKMKEFLVAVKDELANLFDDPESGVFSQGYIYSQLLTKISTDINIVQQALSQRRLNPLTERITHQGYVLQVGSALANASLQKVKTSGLLSTHVTPLTHLRDRIDIRLIPYYDVVLLSIPYGAMNATCDWLVTDYLAIPHEIGHYLFWWGTIELENTLETPLSSVVQGGTGRVPIRETVETATADEPDWVKSWLEELFADAVGCLIAGPVSILGFQEILTSSSPETLEGHDQDDHAHPFPSLRPLIQSSLLRKMGDYEAAAAELDTNWLDWVAQNWPNLKDPLAHTYHLHESEQATGTAILEHLSRPGGPLDEILDVLAPMKDTACWTGNQSLDELYERFTSGGFLESGVETTVPPQISAARKLRSKRVASSRDGRMKEIFGGWTKEGPHGNNPGI